MSRERGLYARDTPILTFPHKGGRDPMSAIRAWFRMAGLASIVRIPAFAGMTKIQTCPCKPMKWEGIRCLRFALGFGYPCRCLCFGFSQIIITLRRRRITLHLAHLTFTDADTFIVSPPPFAGFGFLDGFRRAGFAAPPLLWEMIRRRGSARGRRSVGRVARLPEAVGDSPPR